MYQYIRDWEVSKNIVQDTFTKLWVNREKLRVTTSIKSYLYQAAKNGTIDFIRKENYHKKNVGDYVALQQSTQETVIENESEIIRKRIFEAMAHLKPKCHEIFRLHKFEGLTYQEIADHLNISKRTVEDNVARALNTLREHLKDLRQ